MPGQSPGIDGYLSIMIKTLATLKKELKIATDRQNVLEGELTRRRLAGQFLLNSDYNTPELCGLRGTIMTLSKEVFDKQYPLRPLTSKDIDIVFIHIRHKDKLNLFLDKTPKSVLVELSNKVDEKEEEAENAYRQRTTHRNGGYSMYSDENGGGPVEFCWAKELIAKAIKRKGEPKYTVDKLLSKKK